MNEFIEYQGNGYFRDKPVMILSKDIGGLTFIGYFVRTELIKKVEEQGEDDATRNSFSN